MNNLTLNPEQIQVALNDLLSKPDGLNRVLELALNSFMKAERSNYLSDRPDNKGNGYNLLNSELSDELD